MAFNAVRHSAWQRRIFRSRSPKRHYGRCDSAMPRHVQQMSPPLHVAAPRMVAACWFARTPKKATQRWRRAEGEEPKPPALSLNSRYLRASAGTVFPVTYAERSRPFAVEAQRQQRAFSDEYDAQRRGVFSRATRRYCLMPPQAIRATPNARMLECCFRAKSAPYCRPRAGQRRWKSSAEMPPPPLREARLLLARNRSPQRYDTVPRSKMRCPPSRLPRRRPPRTNSRHQRHASTVLPLCCSSPYDPPG